MYLPSDICFLLGVFLFQILMLKIIITITKMITASSKHSGRVHLTAAVSVIQSSSPAREIVKSFIAARGVGGFGST